MNYFFLVKVADIITASTMLYMTAPRQHRSYSRSRCMVQNMDISPQNVNLATPDKINPTHIIAHSIVRSTFVMLLIKLPP